MPSPRAGPPTVFLQSPPDSFLHQKSSAGTCGRIRLVIMCPACDLPRAGVATGQTLSGPPEGGRSSVGWLRVGRALAPSAESPGPEYWPAPGSQTPRNRSQGGPRSPTGKSRQRFSLFEGFLSSHQPSPGPACLLTGCGGRRRRARVAIVTGRAGSQTFVHCER